MEVWKSWFNIIAQLSLRDFLLSELFARLCFWSEFICVSRAENLTYNIVESEMKERMLENYVGTKHQGGHKTFTRTLPCVKRLSFIISFYELSLLQDILDSSSLASF